MISTTFILKLSLVLKVFCVARSRLDDKCTVARTSENGTCTFVENCPGAILEITEQSIYPALCGFERRKEIICCPNKYEEITLQSRISLPHRISSQSNYLFFHEMNFFSSEFFSSVFE